MDKMRTAMQCCFKVSPNTFTQAEKEIRKLRLYILSELSLSTKFEGFFLEENSMDI